MQANLLTKYLTAVGITGLAGFAAVAGFSPQTGAAGAATTGGTVEHSHPIPPGTTQSSGAQVPAGPGAGEHGGHGQAGHGHAGQAQHGHGGAGHAQEGGHTHTTKLLFSSAPARLEAGQAATWTLKIVDDIDNTPIRDFEVVHDKLLHLIVVSKDTSWFNHLHPEYKGEGVFEITTIVPRAGTYKLYADYRPKEREGEVAQHQFTVAGTGALPSAASLTPDSQRGAWITRTVRSGPDGEPEKTTGPTYQVALMPMPANIEAGKDVMLHFQVRDAAGKPVTLEPYLGAMGHLVLISADSNTYLHTHPMDGGHSGHDNHSGHGTPGSVNTTGAQPTGHEAHQSGATGGSQGGSSDVMFHTTFPQPGLYKAWGQFKHGGQIITASYVLRVNASRVKAATTAPRAPVKGAPAGKTAALKTANPVKTTGGVQKATIIIDGRYTPATLRVKAGRPVQLTFQRREKVGCGDVVQIPGLKLKTRSLKPGEKATLTFTPRRAGTLRFTCGMGMYDGKIIVQ